ASYDRVAADLVVGLQAMRDPGSRSLYRRFVPWQGSRYGAPTYGASIDQLSFVPVEVGAVAPDAFAARISDWYTDGEPGLVMTHPTRDPGDWRYFGTHWNWYFAGAPENDRLYPGPGFQLAKLEWKLGIATGDPVYVERSRRRLDWGRRLEYSALWWFLTGEQEAGAPNGIVDWRDSTDPSQRGEVWARFVDTSACFIEALLMHEAATDTDHNPLPFCTGDSAADGACDADADGIINAADACRRAPDPDRTDSDRDGYGNACDADYDGDGRVGIADFLALGRRFGATTGSAAYAAAFDADGDGAIGLRELLLLGASFGRPPGPSGLLCAGSVPCP
ncbi:MAG TPA: thrombospondin type 3 repeat-containing protein, partial [Myxococcota bacterium]|nr:thrombospondin type 3 repeat-containing protein [Myxococcota bacterium]